MFTAGECRLVCTSSSILVNGFLYVFNIFSLCLCMDIIIFVLNLKLEFVLAEFNPFTPDDFQARQGKYFPAAR